jgi:hypothetical protein
VIARVGRALLAAVVLAAVLGAGELVAPRNVFACSCVQLAGVGAVAGKPDVIVVSGTIENLNPDNANQVGTFTVTRVYQGTLPALRLPIRGGGGGDCTRNLVGVTNAVMVANLDNGVLVPSLCAHFGDLATFEGRQLLAEVDAVFGPPPAPAPTAQAFDPVQLAIVVVTPFVAIVLILVVVAAFRRRENGAEAS